MYTTSRALLEAVTDAGVSFIFANVGSDHTGLLEALSDARAEGRPTPSVITCPNEMVALSAAHGYAQLTGRPQMVLVHVECGTQALAGALHNAAKGRVPALIVAGTSPFTAEGELRGSRNEFAQWIQDVFDQRGLVRGYVKYDNEIRTGRNVKQIVYRALQFAISEPQGPVYITAAREVMEEEVPEIVIRPELWQQIAPCALTPEAAAAIASDLAAARRPLVVTSYLGRKVGAFEELLRLCRRLAIGVVESIPTYLNFPNDDPLYLGNRANERFQNAELAEADLVLVLDSDVPWIPTISKPNADAKVIHIDSDPLKEQMPLWQLPASRVFRADVETALKQIYAEIERKPLDETQVEERRTHYQKRHSLLERQLIARETAMEGGITSEYLTARVRECLGSDAIVLNEGITNYTAIHDHMRRTRPGSIFRSGGASLGWSGGAAIGMKLAGPERTVVSLCGDGSYMFSVPASVYWMARRYRTPFLQIIYNNGGWNAPMHSLLALHPDGAASRASDIGVSFEPAPDYAGIAGAAGDALGRFVREPDELDDALRSGLRAVQVEGRCAVLDVRLKER